jgi:hypothetical protein
VPAAEDPIDLSKDSAFFIDLLDGTHAWRRRVVEEFTFESGTHVRVQSAYQIAFPPDLIEKYVKSGQTSAKVVLPLTTRQKQPLLNFDLVTGAGTPAFLLSRSSTAVLQRDYLARLARLSGQSSVFDDAAVLQLFEAISGFTPDIWREYLRRHQKRRNPALKAYITDASRRVVSPSWQDIQRWEEIALRIGMGLAGYEGRLFDERSSSDDILLALPLMPEPPEDPAGVDDLLSRFASGIEACQATAARVVAPGEEASNEQIDADRFLRVLGEYGARYELVVETEVPVSGPAVLKIAEDRPLNLTLWGHTRQDFAISDAGSAHLEARCKDPNVTFGTQWAGVGKGPVVTDENGDVVGIGLLESARFTPESVSIYTTSADRPLTAKVDLPLRLAPHIYLVALLLSVLNVAALAMAAGVSGGGAPLDRLAILSVPTTIAAAFALTREQTALASRLMRWPRGILVLTTFALWCVVIERLATFHPGGAGQ